MILLPSLDYRFQTERTAEEICMILKSATISEDRIFPVSRQEEFTGRINASEFRLVSNIRNRNSFLPVIKGTMQALGNQTEICIQMRMHPLVSVFMMTWMCGVLFFFLTGIIQICVEGILSALPLLCSTALMMTFAQILMRACFYLPAKKSLQRIEELLETVDIKGGR